MEQFEFAMNAVKILSDKKAENLSAVRITEVSSLADYLVIATGRNSTHVKSLADELEEQLKRSGRAVDHIEGHGSDSWILLDYSDVIVHIFSNEAREYYSLDRLWQDGEIVDISKYTAEE